VFGDGEAKINLAGKGGAPELIFAIGMTRAEIRRALDIVRAHQADLLGRWNEIHG
jgi:hypothetical protein